MKTRPFPVSHEGELDPWNNSWAYRVNGDSPNKDGTYTPNSSGFVGSLHWARRQAGKYRREGWINLRIIGSPHAG